MMIQCVPKQTNNQNNTTIIPACLWCNEQCLWIKPTRTNYAAVLQYVTMKTCFAMSNSCVLGNWANTWSTWTMPRSCSSFVSVLILCILYYILYKLSRVDNDPWSCSSFVSLDWDQGFQHHLSKWLRTESVAHYKSPKDWLELIPGSWRWWWTRRLTRGWRMRWMRM